ncbi:peroxiredoxin-like family protein [Burkholderia sp. AU6039]|uniref:peroxiredoxin-like family protein n=1 Tax=Burkholderia sp. AU6039 TaxID=2015344 RepID=UPI000B7A5F00|nr:peroxiredoxin-like family protein [Burkholderia sp. AU6039]OXJ20079.1 alkyl hydroperoxide reductase [Burkholderia sp. AU6039]
MSLSSHIDALKVSMVDKIPSDMLQAMSSASQALAVSGIAQKALKVGTRVPSFELPDADGRIVRLNDLLKDGPVVLTFYRGQWCPFCNLTLAALQRELPRIQEAGATLIAISPQTPVATAATVKTVRTTFPVLSDVGNNMARAYGLVFSLSPEMRPIYHQLGANLPIVNGDASYELPLAATYVIGQDRLIAYAFVDSDYTKRMEPSEIVRILNTL